MASTNGLDPLEKLHKRIVRIMTRSSYIAHTAPLFRKLEILKLKDICTLEVAKKMYRYQTNPILHSITPISTIMQNHHHNTIYQASI